MAIASEPCRVLLVDDDEDDYLITRGMLAELGFARFEVEWCATYDDAVALIREHRHDAYLIDYRLGERTGLQLVREAFESRPHAPVIVLTGQGDRQIDLEASALGLTDYLVKQELDPAGLERAIRYGISNHAALNDLARSEERYALATRAANDGIWDWDLATDLIYFSSRWYEILGRPAREGDGTPSYWFELVHEDDRPQLQAAIDAHLAGQSSHLELEHRMQSATGGWRWVLTRGLAIRSPDGAPMRMAGSVSDISERRAAERRLEYDALHDSLTGLPNRALFMNRLDHVSRRSTRDPTAGCAVLFIDIDRFKLVNDSLGHAVGDQLLIALALRIREVLRPGDTIARIGGDEFTLLLDGVKTADDAMHVSDRVQSSLAHPFYVGGHELFATASIGIAVSDSGMEAGDLLRDADIAMYDAKRRGSGSHAVFDESMRDRVVDRLTRENELHLAVEQALLPVHYQPIIDLATGRIRGLEALARWPEGWPKVEPIDFIPIAEETGVIGALGLHVLRTALAALADWRRAGVVADDVCISVNLSGRQLDDPNLPEDVLAEIRAAGLPPRTLWLEITESTLMHDPERMQRIVSDVCAAGVGLHLDDFGTGQSSLAALHQFPVNALKIDRSIVAAITGNGESSGAIVRSTVALAHALGLEVIAEGIEDPVGLSRLRTLGCEYGQGFLFSKPLSAEETQNLLVGWSPSKAAAVADRMTPA